MKTHRIKIAKDLGERIILGNKEIGLFMGNYNVKLFEDSSYWLGQPYRESWDALMEVIKKIKKEVFGNGYDLFGTKHHVYLRICGSCYDVDLESAWEAVVDWIRLFYVSDEIRPHDIAYTRLESSSFLIISDHAIRRFKERVLDIPEDEIKKIFNDGGLQNRINEGGDGDYKLEKYKCIAVIKQFTVVTILSLSEDNSDVIFKGKKIA